MPKNKGKGGKNRRRGKNENEETKRQLEFKEPGQEYSQVVRMLGNGRCECYCFDGVTRLGHIRGKMRKKVWVSAGDRKMAWPPSWVMPASKETRVRVDDFSKIIARTRFLRESRTFPCRHSLRNAVA